MTAKREPILLWVAILSSLQVLTGGAALGEVIGAKPAGLAILVVMALQVGTAVYVRGQVTPNASVGAWCDDGRMVAGPAAHVTDGAPVDVEPAPRTWRHTSPEAQAMLAEEVAILDASEAAYAAEHPDFDPDDPKYGPDDLSAGDLHA